MIGNSHKEHSKTALISALQRFSDAGGSLIQIRTREPIRAATALREQFTRTQNPYHEWSAANGFRNFTTENFVDHLTKGDEADFVAALQRPVNELRSPTSEVRAKSDVVHYFAYLDPAPHMENNPFVLDLIQQYSAILPTSNVAILFITADEPLSMLPNGLCLVTELPTPTIDELDEVLTKMLTQVSGTAGDANASFPGGHTLSDEDIHKVSLLGLGLAFSEFETHVALSIIGASEESADALTIDHLSEGIAKGKTAVIRQSEILELIHAENIADVGGMRRLKDWIGQRTGCYSEEAKEFGIESPKGLVLVGIPGTGKSLVAKAVASVLGIPLVRLDFARVFSKYVGDSETRVRSALAMVESMAPCVLFVDEIDKGLGGSGGGGDSGTSMRVLGSYLTWLQELKSPVFNIVTANRVEGLPPELLRRGRFDQIFSVGMPAQIERKEVLEIHLRKRGRSIDAFRVQELRDYLAASEGYVPAEIESAVKDALILAFSAGEELSMPHVLEALRSMIPMSKSHEDKINAILQWAKDNAIPVNYPEDGKDVQLGEPVVTQRRIISPTRRSTK